MKKYILIIFLGLSGTLHAQKIELNVPPVKQKRTEWCSVAASESVLSYRGKSGSQCQIMEWIRTISTAWGGYNCCQEIPGVPPESHPCNKPVPLGYFDEQVSVMNVLKHFGLVPYKPKAEWLLLENIRTELHFKSPIIIHKNDGSDAHTIVIAGIDGNDLLVMDPVETYNPFYWISYNTLLSQWVGYLLHSTCSKQFPAHCCNGVLDGNETGVDCGGEDCPPCTTPPCSPAHCCNGVPDGDETGTDCGGSCPDCPPPAEPCSNCQQDPDELYIDCGGYECSPCEDVPKERTVTNSNQLGKEVAAFNKITAKDNVVVPTGKNVSFITENGGSIVLQPGFKAEKGCTFTTQRRKDVSDCGRKCGTICKLDYVTQYICIPEYLRIYQLINAVKVVYNIYDKASGEKMYKNSINITSNNEIYVLWDCVIPGIGYLSGTVWFTIEYIVDCCDGTSYTKRQDFSVNYFCYKSSNNDIEDPENPETSLSPPVNTITPQDETTPPSIAIVPNPNPGTFQIETNFPLSDIAHIKITNMFGITVYETQNPTSNTIQLPTSASGQHFVVLILKNGKVLTQKMMLQR